FDQGQCRVVDISQAGVNVAMFKELVGELLLKRNKLCVKESIWLCRAAQFVEPRHAVAGLELAEIQEVEVVVDTQCTKLGCPVVHEGGIGEETAVRVRASQRLSNR